MAQPGWPGHGEVASPCRGIELRANRMVEPLMSDVLFVVLSVAVFAVLALVVRGVEKL
jgi:hypothetical protein